MAVRADEIPDLTSRRASANRKRPMRRKLPHRGLSPKTPVQAQPPWLLLAPGRVPP